MRFLLYVSFLMVLCGCTRIYRNLAPATGTREDVEKFRPAFKTTLYKAQVNVIGKYLSGLLIVKEMPDSTIRMLFSNEIGLKLFDFEFSLDGKFKVYYVIKEMDRGPVIRTLRKDFELVMIRPRNIDHLMVKEDSVHVYFIFPDRAGFYSYLTNRSRTRLLEMQRASKKKVVVQAFLYEGSTGRPDSIAIVHRNFNMNITLKRIKQ
jgi:hypothetical protein